MSTRSRNASSPRAWFAQLAAGSLFLMLVGCGSSNDSDPPPGLSATPQGTVEVIHASSDAPPVKVLFNGSESITDLDYKAVAIGQYDTGDIAVRVNGVLPGGSEATVIPASGDDPVVTLDEGTRLSVIALGDLGDIAPLVLTDDTPAVAADTVRLRVVHAAPAVPQAGDTAVEVWLTEPGADLTNPPSGTVNAVFSFGEVLAGGAIEVPAGTYQIRATPPMTPGTVVYDSGEVTLDGGSNLLVVAVPDTNAASSSPISLIVTNGASASELIDTDTLSNVRVVHASADAPAVDILVDGQPSPVQGLDFLDVAGPVPLTPGATDLAVAASPYAAGDPSVLETTADLARGTATTVLAVGSLSLDPSQPLDALLLQDVTRSIATEAQVRIVHASVIAGPVDIYVLPEGTLTAVDPVPADADPAFADVPFKADTGYVGLADGRYDIAVTSAGSKDVAIGPLLSVPFTAGSVSTVIAVDAPGLGPNPSVLQLNDVL
jgi:hypothetical protein